MLEEAEVQAFLDRVESTYVDGDRAAILNLFSDDDGVSSVGAGLDEVAVSRGQIEQLMGRSGGEIEVTRFSFGHPKVVLRGPLALVTSLVHFRFRVPDETLERMDILRMTMALERGPDGEIRILQSHASLPVSDEIPGRPLPGTERDAEANEWADLEAEELSDLPFGPQGL